MKEKIKLTAISKREMNAIRGGSCGCGCLWMGQGGSSTYDNGNANMQGGLWTPGDGPWHIFEQSNVAV